MFSSDQKKIRYFAKNQNGAITVTNCSIRTGDNKRRSTGMENVVSSILHHTQRDVNPGNPVWGEEHFASNFCSFWLEKRRSWNESSEKTHCVTFDYFLQRQIMKTLVPEELNLNDDKQIHKTSGSKRDIPRQPSRTLHVSRQICFSCCKFRCVPKRRFEKKNFHNWPSRMIPFARRRRKLKQFRHVEDHGAPATVWNTSCFFLHVTLTQKVWQCPTIQTHHIHMRLQFCNKTPFRKFARTEQYM